MSVNLRCSLKELIEATFRALLLRHGCTTCEVSNLIIIEGGQDRGANTYLASVRAPDGRELFRVYGVDDLDRLTEDRTACSYLARAVQGLSRSLGISTA